MMDSKHSIHSGQKVSRMKPLEPKTSQVGILLWPTSQKKKLILGFDLIFQTQDIGEVQKFKGFKPKCIQH